MACVGYGVGPTFEREHCLRDFFGRRGWAVAAEGLVDLFGTGQDEGEFQAGGLEMLLEDGGAGQVFDGDDDEFFEDSHGDGAALIGKVAGEKAERLGVDAKAVEIDVGGGMIGLAGPGLPDVGGRAQAPGDGDLAEGAMGESLFLEDLFDVVIGERDDGAN